MAYEWNPLWPDVVDDFAPSYVGAVRRMVIASINWIDQHPDAVPEWSEPDKQALARMVGVPPGVAISDVAFICAWEDMYTPKNAHARHWFRAMADACGTGKNAPSNVMMSKAVYCGLLFKKVGWNEFNTYMLEHVDPSATRQ